MMESIEILEGFMYAGLGGGPAAGGGGVAVMGGGAGTLAFTGFPALGAALLAFTVLLTGLLFVRASRIRADTAPDLA